MTRRTRKDIIERFCDCFLLTNGVGEADRPSPITTERVMQIRHTRDQHPDADAIWLMGDESLKAEIFIRLDEIYDGIANCARMVDALYAKGDKS